MTEGQRFDIHYSSVGAGRVNYTWQIIGHSLQTHLVPAQPCSLDDELLERDLGSVQVKEAQGHSII